MAQTKSAAAKQLDNFLEIPIANIVPSPTNPRKHFDADKLNELAESIKLHGVKSPVLVRLKKISDASAKHGLSAKDTARLYELIFGERRLKASAIAGLQVIPAQLVEMDDAEVLDVQFEENLKRDDLNPMDEAAGYQSMLDKVKSMDVAEIARRIGKSEKYVHQRLKLNSLIPEAKDALAKDALTLGHALELARISPEAQKEAFPKCFITSWETNWKPDISAKGLYPVAKLREHIETKVFLKLKGAPFSTKDTRLREDNLACKDCPERTGYNPILFDDIAKDDRCLNRKCFEAKTAALVQIKQKELSESARVETTTETAQVSTSSTTKKQQPEKKQQETRKAEYEAPLLSDSWTPNVKGALGLNQHYKEVEGKKSCEFAERGVFAEGRRIGQTILICREAKCKTHWDTYRAPAKTDDDPSVKGKRKQEIFDVKVAEAVRQKVLRLFYETLEVKEDSLPLERKYIEWIAAKQWQKLESHQKTLILELLSEVFDDAKHFPYEFDAIVKRFQNFSTKVLCRFMALCSIIHYGENRYGNSFEKQTDVIKLAEDHNIDYKLFDAQERVAQSPKKHRWDAERYLRAIEDGTPEAVKPEVWESPAQAKRLKAEPLIPLKPKSATPVEKRAAATKKSRKGGKK